MDHDFEITIVGAGVCGLAVAAEISGGGREVCLVEKNESYGLETSSRNSEVIHSGIYYPQGTLKAGLCVRGKQLLYELCEKHGIPHRRLGKLVVASSREESLELRELKENGRRNGVDDLVLIDRQELARLEPPVAGEAALLSPSTGIIDSHSLMRYFEQVARRNGVTFSYNAEVVGLSPESGGYRVGIRQSGQAFSFLSRVVVNCAGLRSDRIAAAAGIDIADAGYRLHYSKGEYFSVLKRPETLVNHLIYPVPQSDSGWLGVHITLDLQGQMKLGPSAQDVEEIDYSVDPGHQQMFFAAARKYLPLLTSQDLRPDTAGVRPKLAKEGEGFRDFVIRDETDKGLPGLIDLIGIESPGLTCSPAIAAYVANIVHNIL
jgi:L-2-hydroxyglutarate oxidase LhgO